VVNKLFALRTEQGYTLRKSTRQEGSVTNYEDVSKGLTYAELIGAIVHIPDEFYVEGVEIKFPAEANLNGETKSIHLSKIEMIDLNRTVREHQKRIKRDISNK
jgi:hypothetical protein